MNIRENKKKITIYLILVAVLAGVLFGSELSRDNKRNGQEMDETSTQAPAEVQIETKSAEELEQEAQEAAEIDAKTTFWYWEGKEAGAPSKEYLTLRGDGIYILQIELADRNPEELTGKYTMTQMDEGTRIRIYRDHERQDGILKGSRITFENKKVFTQTPDSHL